MSNIVASALSAAVQADGSHQVREIHTDLAGLTHYIDYLAAVGDDMSANMAVHATNLGNDLQAAEMAANVLQVETVGSLAGPTFVYSTAAQNLTALRAAYQTASQVQAIMIGDFLSSLTNAQLETIFGDTLGQITTLRANALTPAATNAAAIRAAAGQ
jgi:hypothetical protein